jgi:hypothetical protein
VVGGDLPGRGRRPGAVRGWAAEGDVYRCADNDCGCGWEYAYQPGEPKGMRWPTPLIQITATSEDQTDNIYRHVKAMIRLGPLSGLMHVGESMVRIGAEGEIDTVTTGALSKLGNPVTFAMQDETGLYTDTNKLRKVAETQRRGAAGMGGRSMETTNCYDPSEDSVAQRTHESAAQDVFRFYEPPPRTCRTATSASAEDPRVQLRRLPAQRHRLDRGEAAELAEKDPAQAERYYGNRLVYGAGTWLEGDKWEARKPSVRRSGRHAIVLGFDGSDVDDWTAIRARPRRLPVHADLRPDQLPTIWDPAKHNGQVPRLEVAGGDRGAVRAVHVVRIYATRRTGRPRSTPGRRSTARRSSCAGRRTGSRRCTPPRAASHRRRQGDSAFTHDGCP